MTTDQSHSFLSPSDRAVLACCCSSSSLTLRWWSAVRSAATSSARRSTSLERCSCTWTSSTSSSLSWASSAAADAARLLPIQMYTSFERKETRYFPCIFSKCAAVSFCQRSSLNRCVAKLDIVYCTYLTTCSGDVSVCLHCGWLSMKTRLHFV